MYLFSVFVFVFLLTLCLQFLYLCWNSLCVALFSLNSVTNSLRAVFIDLRSKKIWTNWEKRGKNENLHKPPHCQLLLHCSPLPQPASGWTDQRCSYADHHYCYHDYHHLHGNHDDHHYPDVDDHTSSHSSSWIASHCRSFTVLHSSTCGKFHQSSVLSVLMINQYHYDWYYKYMNVFLGIMMLTRRVELNCGFVVLSWVQFSEPITVIVDEILITRSRLVKDLCWWELISSVCITNTNTNLLCDTFLVLDFSTNLTNQMV